LEILTPRRRAAAQIIMPHALRIEHHPIFNGVCTGVKN
jgi:hypothetical protein